MTVCKYCGCEFEQPKKGRRIGKIEIIKLKLKGIILRVRYKLSKKYRDEINNLPF